MSTGGVALLSPRPPSPRLPGSILLLSPISTWAGLPAACLSAWFPSCLISKETRGSLAVVKKLGARVDKRTKTHADAQGDASFHCPQGARAGRAAGKLTAGGVGAVWTAASRTQLQVLLGSLRPESVSASFLPKDGRLVQHEHTPGPTAGSGATSCQTALGHDPFERQNPVAWAE